MNENKEFIKWFKLLDYETDSSIPEEYVPYLEMAFEAGQKAKQKKALPLKKNVADLSLFSESDLDIQNYYTGMPEYDNKKGEEPLITALFKFSTLDDFEDFKNKVSNNLYEGEKVFDGMQKLTEKQSWYPHKLKASNYMYVDEGEK